MRYSTKLYMTEAGYKARIDDFREGHLYPLIGSVQLDDGRIIKVSWTLDGHSRIYSDNSFNLAGYWPDDDE